jgi:hypothetical protein
MQPPRHYFSRWLGGSRRALAYTAHSSNARRRKALRQAIPANSSLTPRSSNSSLLNGREGWTAAVRFDAWQGLRPSGTSGLMAGALPLGMSGARSSAVERDVRRTIRRASIRLGKARESRQLGPSESHLEFRVQYTPRV